MVSNTTSFGLDYIHEFLDPCQNKSHYCGILYTSYLEMQNLKQSGISIVVVQEKYHTYPAERVRKKTLPVSALQLLPDYHNCRKNQPWKGRLFEFSPLRAR